MTTDHDHDTPARKPDHYSVQIKFKNGTITTLEQVESYTVDVPLATYFFFQIDEHQEFPTITTQWLHHPDLLHVRIIPE